MSDSPVLLIDLSALFRAAWHVVPSDGSPNIAFDGTMGAIRRSESMTREYLKLDSDEKLRIAICCDGKGNWRKELSKDYKAQREQQPAAMYGLLDRVKERLRRDAYLLWECDGYEADDIIGTAVDGIAALDGFGETPKDSTTIVIASHDKDLCQLSAENVILLKTHTWNFATRNDVIEKFKILPHMIVEMFALMGDKSDNVRGCEGCGDKTAISIIQKYETVQKLYSYIENPVNTATDKFWRTADGKKPLSILDKLLKSKDDVLLSRKLVALKYDAPIDISDLDKKIEPQKRVDDGFGGFDEPEENAACATCGMVPCACDEIERAFGKDPSMSEKSESPETVKDSGTAVAVEGSAEKGGEVAAETKPLDGGPTQVPNATPAATSDDGKKDVPVASQALTKAIPTQIVVASERFDRQLEPNSPESAVRLGQLLYNSGLYQKFPNPAAITAVIIRGREMGLGALTSCDAFHVVEGKPAPHAHLIAHLGETHADLDYMFCSETTETQCTYEFRRKSWPQGKVFKHTYTIQEAIDAGLCTLEKAPRDMTKDKDGKLVKDRRSNWDKRRREMIRKTCVTQGVRIVFPGSGLGLTSVAELGGNEED